MTSSKKQLVRSIDSMNQVKVLVVGDVMLDMYEQCAVKRISPEAPVPIASVISTAAYLGGAGNVANNVRALGATVSLVSVVGNDREGEHVRKLLIENGIQHYGVIVDIERTTTLKKRVVSGTQQLIRIDREVTSTICSKTSDALRIFLKEAIREHDVIIISDYCKGVISDSIIECVKAEALTMHKKVFVDSKTEHLKKYEGVYLIKPNKVEAETFVGELFTRDYSNLESIIKQMSDTLHANLVVTLGGDGMALYASERFLHKKTNAREVFDVSGAGDTVLATIATAVGSGATLEEAVDLSNYSAGYVVGRLGTVVCTQDTLRTMFTHK